MSGWEMSALSDICEIRIGRTPSRSQREYWGVGHPWLSIADMKQGRRLKNTKEQITHLAADKVMGAPVPAGTVLLSFKLSIGKVGISEIPIYTNEAIAALPVKDPGRIDSAFLYWALRSINLTGDADRAAMGRTLNKSKLARLQIPIPPLSEQRRIVQALDQAEALRTKRHEAIALFDDLVRSVFIEMFGDSDAAWPRVTVADLTDGQKAAIRTGPFGSQLLHEEFVDSGIAVLGIDNAVDNEFKWQGRRFITEEKYAKLVRYTVRPGDVLITIMGTCGRCAVVPDDIPVAINTKHLCCITLDKSRCLPEFLHGYFLMHPVSRAYLGRNAKGAIMAGLNMGIIKELPVHLPPIELQADFVQRVRAVRMLKAEQEHHLAMLDALMASIQHRAFRGELWVDSSAA
ncbi:restriction endonuclease subunit S [Streptomyces sp. NPDC002125]